MSTLARFLVRCAGLRIDAARLVPYALQGSVTLGGLLVILGVLGSMTWGYAAYRLFLGDAYAPIVAVFVGALGGLFVFAVDRSLALSVNKFGPLWKSALQVGGRVLLAAGLAWTMSTPAILRFSRTVIATHLFNQRRLMITDQKTLNEQFADLPGRKQTVSTLADEKASREAQLTQPPDSAEYARAMQNVGAASASSEQARASNNPRIAGAQRELARIVDNTDRPSTDRAGTLRRQINAWRAEIGSADRALASARAEERRLFEAWYRDIRTALDGINDRLPQAQQEASAATAQVVAMNDSSVRTIDGLLEPNLAREYTAFLQVTSDDRNADAASLRIWAIAFHGLFFMFEMLPLIVKLTWPRGPVEEAVEALDEEDRQRVTIAVNARMVVADALQQAKAEVDLKSIEDLKDSQLRRPVRDHEQAAEEWDVLGAWLLSRRGPAAAPGASLTP